LLGPQYVLDFTNSEHDTRTGMYLDFLPEGAVALHCYMNWENNIYDVVGASTVTSELETWRMISCIYNGETLQLYLDGVLVPSFPSPSTTATPFNTLLTIGSTSATYQSCIGSYAGSNYPTQQQNTNYCE
jgi:hypothetical protein